MTEKITVEFDVEDNGSSAIAKINGELNDTKKAGEGAAEGTKKVGMSMTDLYSTLQLAEQGARMLNDAWKATAGEAINLSNTVRQFRDVTGQTAEESSRLVQVLDDYKVSVGAAEQATKKLSKEGLQFNIETLAQLSDEYLSLNDKAAQTQFLYDKFGKSGTDFAEIMLQGKDAILAANDAIDENLILTDKALQQAREYEQNVDNLNDSMLALKVSIGNNLIPVVNNLFDAHEREIEAMKRLGIEYGDFIAGSKKVALEQEIEKIRLEEVATARWNGIAALYGEKTATEESTEATDGKVMSLDDLTRANKDYLKSIGDTTREIDNQKQKLDEIKEKYGEGSQEYADATIEFEMNTHRRMLAMLEEQLAVDGLTQKETDYLMEIGQKWGIYSDEAVEAMAAIQREIDALERNIDININVHTNYSEAGQAALTAQLAGEKNYIPSRPARQNAKGGSYMIPMSWGNERFPIGISDTASGGELISITPKGKDPNAELIAAIYATRLDPRELARIIKENALQVVK